MKWRSSNVLDAVCSILDARLDPAPDRTVGRFRLTEFQRSGVRFARMALAARGLAIIADDVGTGKSIMALRLIDDALGESRDVLLAVPAGLRTTWCRLLGEERRARVILRSHTELALHGAARLAAGSLAVVDEAHAFRNPATRRHAALARAVAGARTLLVTATPVNNSLLDLYFLLRIRLADGAFADLGVSDLGAAFREAARARRVEGGLGRALDQVLLRRPREEQGVSGSGVSRDADSDGQPDVRQSSFPRRVLHGVTYPAGVGEPFAAALAELADRRLTAYDPLGASGAGDLVRLVLLKRIESGVAAFVASVDRVLAFHRRFLDALACGRLVTARLRPADEAQLELPILVGSELPPGLDRRGLATAVEADLEALSAARLAVASVPDPKLARLRDLLDARAGRRILVFTEFRETARAIHASLRGRPGIARIDGTGAWLGQAPVGRLGVVRRFSPVSNGARPPPARELVSVLIATDVLSEGLNLQDADTVVNYDLPWNPVRLIQRMGRIDRLGSPHDVIDVFDFLPDRNLDRWITLVDTLSGKVESIAAAMGGVRPVLPSPILPAVRRDPVVSAADALRDLCTGIPAQASQASGGLEVAASTEVPPESVPVAFPTAGPVGILLVVAEPEIGFRLVRNGEITVPETAEAIGWLRDAMRTDATPAEPAAALPVAELDRAAARIGRSTIVPGSAGARAALRVLALAATGDADLAQALIDRLGRVPPGMDAEVRSWVEAEGRLDELDALLARVEWSRPRVLAAFVFR